VDFPVNLKIEGRRCLVVGGGPVAVRKARALRQAGGDVVLVAPRAGTVRGAVIRRRPFAVRDLDGVFFAVCATDDEALNARVAALCDERGILVNVVDRPALCSVTFPAVLRRGALTIAISTDGRSPAVAKALRRELETFCPASMAKLVRILGDARDRRPAGRARMRFFADLVTPEVLADARRGRFDRVKRALHP
jgi:siroheme synthase-like protein